MRLIILCGGNGSRLWPLSRERLPKQFIPIFEEKSLLDLTIERILKLSTKKPPIFVCNIKHRFLVKNSLDKYALAADILLEPENKNTCAAIYLAAKHCNEDENVLIMPSDHLISNDDFFLKIFKTINDSFKTDYLITFGMKPSKPSQAFGYIKTSQKTKKYPFKVLQFIEKPDLVTASKFYKSSQYYWNMGIFGAKASMIINSIKNHAYDIARSCDKVFQKKTLKNGQNEIHFPKLLYKKIPSQSIDYAIMEKEKKILLYPFNGKWSDLGSWDAIDAITDNKVKNNQIIEIESSNNFIRNEKTTIATIGVKDLIIVSSDNAILISKKQHSEKVKLIVEELTKKKSNVVKEHSYEDRPWGSFQILHEDKNCKVKKIIISPNKRLSLQYHNFRSEHWLVISGKAKVLLDGVKTILCSGQSISIPVKSKHYVENTEIEDLIIIETQLGSYFGEDDIIRLYDPHER